MPVSKQLHSAYIAAYDDEMDEMQQSQSQPISMQHPSSEAI